MIPGRLFWKLFLGNAVLMAAVLVSLGWLVVTTVDRFSARELTDHLRTQASTIIEATDGRFDTAHAADLEDFVRRLRAAQAEDIRYTLVLPDGSVLADSDADPAKMEPHGDRAEVRQALIHGWGEDTRLSQTLGRDLKYVAVRIGSAEHPFGVVRTAMPLRSITERTGAEHKPIWTIAFTGVVMVVLLALGIARLWSQPIRRIVLTAQNLSRGDLSSRVPEAGRDELGMLARSLNQMRGHLASQLETIDKQRRVLESILAQISEGVIVAGPDRRIVLINPAAVRLLGLSAAPTGNRGTFQGVTVRQCISQGELQQALIHAPEENGVGIPSGGSSDAVLGLQEIKLQLDGQNGHLSLLARACDVVLPGPSVVDDRREQQSRPVVGRLLVLTDITELSQMIQIKADFAANTSHELRTPLSAIRGAVETLLEMDFADDPQSARRFLGVIDRHSSRMMAMITDLLNLSRLESSQDRFKPRTLKLPELLAELKAHYADLLAAKKLRWQADIAGPSTTIVANPYLLRLTLENLLDNAVKFTDEEGSIAVACRDADRCPDGRTAVAIEVIDTGCGIPEEEQGRVFERFYQVERSRSGATRGTGLGLSIVRHAVAAMQGNVSLRSKVGEGTTVTITIPQPDPSNPRD
jgi:two-component system, OmpR family, phosphate regulon sensor histidine kinase PhoR